MTCFMWWNGLFCRFEDCGPAAMVYRYKTKTNAAALYQINQIQPARVRTQCLTRDRFWLVNKGIVIGLYHHPSESLKHLPKWVIGQLKCELRRRLNN